MSDSVVNEATHGQHGEGDSANVPKFLANAFELIENPDNHEYIDWNENGTVMIIKNVHGLSEMVLPKYYSHSNYASFVRQLNMYGFTRADQKTQTFKHPMFLKGRPELLSQIKRKISTPVTKIAEQREKELADVMQEVEQLRSKQQQFDDEILRLKSKNNHLDKENHMLWQAVNEARNRQKTIAQKLRVVLMYLYRNYNQAKIGSHDIEMNPEFSPQDVPKLMDAARKIGLPVDAPDIHDPDDVPTPLDYRVVDNAAKIAELPDLNNDNELRRMSTVGTLGSFAFDAFPSSPTDNKLDYLQPSSQSNELVPRAQSLEPRNRADSIQLSNSIAGTLETDDVDVNNLMRGLSSFFNDQDDTLRRIESISSTFSDSYEPPVIEDMSLPADSKKRKSEEMSKPNMATSSDTNSTRSSKKR